MGWVCITVTINGLLKLAEIVRPCWILADPRNRRDTPKEKQQYKEQAGILNQMVD